MPTPGNTTQSARLLATLLGAFSGKRLLPTKEDLQSRGPLWLLIAVCLGVLCWKSRNPDYVAVTNTIEVVRIVEVEKKQARDLSEKTASFSNHKKTVTETKPDGTTIKTEEVSSSGVVNVSRLAEKTVEKIRQEEQLTSRTEEKSNHNYTAGGGILLDSHLNRTYYIEAGIRIADLPVFITTLVTSSPAVGLGIRVEF